MAMPDGNHENPEPGDAATVSPAPPSETPSRWTSATRLAFRFCAVYLGLYVLTTQMLGALIPQPLPHFPPLETLPPLRSLLMWTADHMMHLEQPPLLRSGSGDKVLNWLAVPLLLAFSVVGTALWTALDRPGRSDARGFAWFRVFLRFALGATMIQYGLVKVVPLQMPYPSLSRLVEPFGHLSPMGVLWASIGASPAYEIFVGAAEVLGGVLLFLPRTALLGSLVCLADAVEVFALNMTYDVPVKLFSFHLILMSLFLLAPYASSLLNVIVLRGAGGATAEPHLVRGRRGRRLLTVAQAVLGVWLVGSTLSGSRAAWRQYGGGAPRPPLYGLWDVAEMRVDGNVLPPLLTDLARWRRVIVQSAGVMTVQRMDDTFAYYRASLDTATDSLTLTAAADTAWAASFAVGRASPDTLTLDGRMDGRAARLVLSRIDAEALPLPSRGFHWVQEFPYNR